MDKSIPELLDEISCSDLKTSDHRILQLTYAFAERAQQCGAVCAAMQIGAVVGAHAQTRQDPSCQSLL
eukprot:1215336-Amphidinium_carterae.1